MLPSTFTPGWLHLHVHFRLNLNSESTSRQFTLKQIMQEEVTGQQINVKQEKIKTNIEGSMTSLTTNLKQSPLQLKIPLWIMRHFPHRPKEKCEKLEKLYLQLQAQCDFMP